MSWTFCSIALYKLRDFHGKPERPISLKGTLSSVWKMADKGKDLRSFAEKDREAIELFNKKYKANLDREARLMKHFEWRGNKLPPFSIEPVPYERQRLDGGWMSEEDRQLRRQWLKDQELSPKEPRFIPELYPKNPIRRLLAAPWDATFNALTPIIGKNIAEYGRFFTPKVVMTALSLYAIYYHLKYNPNRWTDKHGWHIYSTKPTLLPHGAMAPHKEHDDYYDKGFKCRTVLRDLKTSTAP